MNGWRKELNGLLAAERTPRPVALRRSLREDFLYATDLPAVDEAAAGHFTKAAEEAGWIVERCGDWLQLDRREAGVPEGIPALAAGPEARCCASLLKRHAGRTGEPDRRAERRLVKASEAGPAAWEKVCEELHGEWAERLRKHEPLPGLPAALFSGGETEC